MLEYHLPLFHVKMYKSCTVRALFNFDGVFLPDFGTQHLPANYLSDNSCEIPIVMTSSAKVAAAAAATFAPMYV